MRGILPRLAAVLVAGFIVAAVTVMTVSRRSDSPASGQPVTEASAAYVPRPAGSLTFCKHVAPIVHRQCSTCHHPGSSGPFSLIDYDDCRSRAGQLADVVSRGIMPPWLPDHNLVEYVDQRVLTAEEIGVICQWVEEGALEGDASDLPPLPRWNDGWRLGDPDLIVALPDEFLLPADGTDVFHNFVIPVPVRTAKFVRAVEIRPVNPQVVHHGVLLIDPTQNSRRLDERDDEPGFGGMIYGLKASSPDGHFLGWTPGKRPYEAPPGMAWQLQPGTDLVLQLHMLPTGKPETVQARIGLYFTDEPPTRHPVMLRLGSLTIDIAAGDSNARIDDSFELPVSVDVLGVYPHAHYLAHEMTCIADLTDGSQKHLLQIPQWDFNWQDEYRFVTPVRLPKGTRLRMSFTYDNSEQNVRNPHHPPQRTVWGPQSSDEMGDLWIQVVAQSPSDDHILRRAYGRKEFVARLDGYKHAVRVNPDHVESRYNLACLLEQVHAYDEAAEQYVQALTIDPSHVQSLNNLGVIWCKRGRISEAIPLFEKAIEFSPEYRDALENFKEACRLQKADSR